MIKQRGNIALALAELAADTNNAVAHIYPNASFGQGELANATVTIKDVYATQDAPMQASSLILRGFQPHYDAAIITKLREAGAAIVAKVHSDELALGGTGTYSAWGLVTNPLDSARLVGGSSSGSAATLTKNISLAIASDTGDSVRLPASYIGAYGFKPSYGAISRWGLAPFASSLDTVGYFGHNVHDLIIASKVLFGRDLRDMTSRPVDLPVVTAQKPKIVGFLTNANTLPIQTQQAYEHLAKTLEKDNVVVKRFTIDQELLAVIDACYMAISFSEASSNTANLSGINFGNTQAANSWSEVMTLTRSIGFGPMVQRRLALGAFYLLQQNQVEIFDKARKVRQKIVNAFNALYAACDLVVFPAATAAPLISEGKSSHWCNSYLIQANLSGNPSLTIPWIKQGHLPIGLSLDAPLYADKRLLSYGLYFETLLGKNHG